MCSTWTHATLVLELGLLIADPVPPLSPFRVIDAPRLALAKFRDPLVTADGIPARDGCPERS